MYFFKNFLQTKILIKSPFLIHSLKYTLELTLTKPDLIINLQSVLDIKGNTLNIILWILKFKIEFAINALFLEIL